MMDFITEPNPRLSSSWQLHVFRSQFRYFPPRGQRNASLLASDSLVQSAEVSHTSLPHGAQNLLSCTSRKSVPSFSC